MSDPHEQSDAWLKPSAKLQHAGGGRAHGVSSEGRELWGAGEMDGDSTKASA